MTKPWHTLTPEEAMKELHVSEKGLSQPEAQRRLAQCGPNELQKEKRAKLKTKVAMGMFS